LPDEYDRIYTFKHYTKTHQSVLAEQESKAFAYPSFYISVTIKGFPADKIVQHSAVYPIIMTFLLKHERKMTQLHTKVRRNPYYPSNNTIIESNQYYSISMGFRRIVVKPIFSRVIPGT
jgi:pre-rRNA-processing protein TSR1